GDDELEPGFDADPQSLAHTYVNEADPDLFPDSCYTATLTVKDKDGGEGTDSLCVQVLNQAPLLPESLPDLEAVEGTPFSFATDALDPGVLDTLTYTVSWGDESDPAELVVPPAERNGDVSVTHVYRQHGTRVVRVEVEDDGRPEPGSDARWFSVQVRNDRPIIVVPSDPVQLTFYHGVENCVPVVVRDRGLEDPATCAAVGNLPANAFLLLSSEPREGDPELGEFEKLACRLCWVPAEEQIGQTYQLRVRVTDDVAEDAAEQGYEVRVEKSDADEDGCPDTFELQHDCMDPEVKDCSDDHDGDRLFTLDEYRRGTDPCDPNLPTAPSLAAPADGVEITTFTPTLLVNNAEDADVGVLYNLVELRDLDPLRYWFQVGQGLAGDDPQIAATNAPVGFSPSGNLQNQCALLTTEGALQTSWTVPESTEAQTYLVENEEYEWRARACDGFGFSPWAGGTFFVNTLEEPPMVPVALAPVDGVEDLRLPLEFVWTCSQDPDRDAVSYRVEFSARGGGSLAKMVVTGCHDDEQEKRWTVDAGLLDDDKPLCWQVIAVDEHGTESEPSAARCLLLNGDNRAPVAPTLLAPAPSAFPETTSWIGGADVTEIATARPTFRFTAPASPDPDGNEVTWAIEVDTEAGYASENLVTTGLTAADRLVVLPGAEGSWTPTVDLLDDTLYRWRVRGFDLQGAGAAAEGAFFVNLTNDPCQVAAPLRPLAPDLNPATMLPVLAGQPGSDPDHDVVSYDFQVAVDEGFAELIAETPPDGISQAEGEEVSWTVDTQLVNRQPHWWRYRCCDLDAAAAEGEGEGEGEGEEAGTGRLCGDWSPAVAFVPTASNQCPTGIAVLLPEDAAQFVRADVVELKVQNPTDPDFGTELKIVFEVYLGEAFLEAERLVQASVELGTDGTTSYFFERPVAEEETGLLNQYSQPTLYWRARADDGEDNCSSEWTASRSFLSVGEEKPKKEEEGCCPLAVGGRQLPGTIWPLWLLVIGGLLVLRAGRRRR
ncbi:MAG: hypothetical protein RBU45_08155, partial [Myxococcota bacterium]|nr:hypothetical protein [Myxococcota bacterium]